MQRRRFVAGLGASGFGLLTGCVAPDGGGRQSTDGGSPTDGEPTNTPGTDTDGPPVDAPFPPNRDDVAEVRWHRQISNPESALVLEPSTNAVSLPTGDIAFTLSNGTDRTFRTNFYSWAVYRWENGRWHHVAPTMTPDPLHSLPPGDSHRWTLTVDDTDLSKPSFRTQGTADVTVEALGGGTYAFAVDGWWADQEATPTYEHKSVRAVRFPIEGDPLELEPSSAVTDVQREEDAVVVTATNERAAQTDEDRPATFVLTHDESADDPRQLITEQVYRTWPLRDALAHAGPDVAEVRVETTTTSVPAFGGAEDHPPLAYDGRTYRLSVDDSRE